MYYKWSKAFLEAGKRQLNGDTIREAGSDEVKELRTENDSLKMVVAELTLRNRTLKNLAGFGIRIHRYMRFTQSEKMEIIRMVEESSLSVKQTLLEMDVSRSSFYEWYRRYKRRGRYGDLTKGGRQATGQELVRFAGADIDGTPRGSWFATIAGDGGESASIPTRHSRAVMGVPRPLLVRER